jgi:hypothetical protein
MRTAVRRARTPGCRFDPALFFQPLDLGSCIRATDFISQAPKHQTRNNSGNAHYEFQRLASLKALLGEANKETGLHPPLESKRYFPPRERANTPVIGDCGLVSIAHYPYRYGDHDEAAVHRPLAGLATILFKT